ncbi:hypothetical protein SAMN05444166_4174 [Singulisphaera sp. GP187]|nr:hypothetical protein SAMN05444166_4174 [Singulisphaera sp. GP187]
MSFVARRMKRSKEATPPTLSWSVFEKQDGKGFVRAVAWTASESDAKFIAKSLNQSSRVAK